jgi:hypothetical protein
MPSTPPGSCSATPEPDRVTASIGHGEFGDYPVDDDGVVTIDWDDRI